MTVGHPQPLGELLHRQQLRQCYRLGQRFLFGSLSHKAKAASDL